jgi:hypothetical protein
MVFGFINIKMSKAIYHPGIRFGVVLLHIRERKDFAHALQGYGFRETT